MSVALILGGGEHGEAEAVEAKALCARAGLGWSLFAVNDRIAVYPEECRAVTLHPEKILGWLKERATAGCPAPVEVWGHHAARAKPGFTHYTADWRGSSGLLATKIALELGFRKAILCGVPMTGANHYVRRKPWSAHVVFRPAWLNQKRRLLPHVRSLSGWTAELLGVPTAEFLTDA